MREWRADVIQSWRRLRAAPVFALLSVVTLALGIGATTAIYSVVYAAVLRPPDFPDAHRVANLYHSDPRSAASAPMLSRADYEDYRAAQTSFQFVTAWNRFRLPLSANGSVELLMGEAVSGEYFSVVQVVPALGRAIQSADDRPGAVRVIVLSDAVWRQQLAADPNIVGRTVRLGGETFDVIGVAPATFRGVDMPNVLPTAAWIPLSAAPLPNPNELADRERRTVFVKGRLEPGRSMDEAQAELRAIAQRLDLAYPIGRKLKAPFRRPSTTSRPWLLIPATDIKMHESVDALVRPLVATVMVAVGLVLLVACTNIANLVLARGAARRHEMAIRLALGASRWRLVREQIVETTIVTLFGSAAAVFVARILMTRLLSGDLRVAGMSLRFAPEMNTSVAAVAVASIVVALVTFGVIPALHGSRGDIREALASDGQNTLVPRWRGRRGLIVCQVAVSAGLVSVAVLCAEQLIALARHDTGIDIDRLALARLAVGMKGRDEAQNRWALTRMLDASRRLPNVESAALSSGFPIELGGGGGAVGLAPEELLGGYYEFIVCTPGVFATWGASIVQGRGFDDRDMASSERVAIVTEPLARHLFPNGSAVGRQIVLRWSPSSAQPEQSMITASVVGIASDMDAGTVGNRGGGVLYLPWTQHSRPAMTLTLRTAGDPAALLEPLKRTVKHIDPEVPVMDAAAGSSLRGARHVVLKVGAGAAGSLGWLALVLAMTGLYGVLSELVLRRTRELGIRMALGADSRRLLRMVLLDGARPVLAGLAVGLGCGVILRFAFRPLFLRMLPAFDPVVVALVPLAFLAAAFIAAYVPARRASRVDPNVALRQP